MTARLDYRASSARTRPAVATVTALAIVKDPWIWTTLAVRGHPYEEADMPAAHVVFVWRTEVLPDGRLSDRLAAARRVGLANGQRLRPWRSG